MLVYQRVFGMMFHMTPVDKHTNPLQTMSNEFVDHPLYEDTDCPAHGIASIELFPLG